MNTSGNDLYPKAPHQSNNQSCNETKRNEPLRNDSVRRVFYYRQLRDIFMWSVPTLHGREISIRGQTAFFVLYDASTTLRTSMFSLPSPKTSYVPSSLWTTRKGPGWTNLRKLEPSTSMLPRQLVQELDIGLLYLEAPTSDEVEEILAGAQSQALVWVIWCHRPEIILLEWSLDSPLERHSDCRMVTLKIKASCLIDAILLPPDPLEMRILEWDQEEECLETLLLEEEMEEVVEEEEAAEVEENPGGGLPGGISGRYGGGIPPSGGKGKVRPPDIFTGDHHKSQAFIDSLWLLFTGDPTRFTSDNVKIATALSYISGENVDYWVRNKIESAQYLGLGTWYNFVRDFTLVFAPLNEAENAILALEQLNLKSDSTIHEFNGKYNELIRKSRIFDAQARLSYYRNALPAWLRTKISTSYPVPKTIEQWIE
ncbi:hypothetical protein GSI_14984 [Ganoderma sinense ZZ0214-1]|uniref:Retrotransposon gag domain-containing protein n=1 Tax=Ganoderma sinense ZZ0214-1 TaxID=1077348 RepID=A0A2G8RL44_9APHY|nr:hypothetical protein GSI_14984 [Ganoderma sinense ZZ0214-1]